MDCIDGMNLIDNNSIDLIVTSPPYFNARDYSHWNTYQEYLNWLKTVSTKMFDVLKPGHFCCVNISVVIQPREKRSCESTRFAIPFHYVGIMEEIGFKFLEDIIWVKPEGSSFNRNGGFYRNRQPIQYKPNVVNEYILVFQKPNGKLIDDVLREYSDDIKEQSLVEGEYERTNVWCINPETKSKHPAPFPEKIPYNLIRYYSYVGDTVLDPFSGSGTTLKVAKENKRNFIGFELSKEYYEMANKRIEETSNNLFYMV